jgi:integrase
MKHNGDVKLIGIFKRGPRWFYHFTHRGRQIKRASAVNSPEGAMRARGKALERIAQGLEPFERLHADYTVEQALTAYVEEGGAGRRASTQRHYTYRIGLMARHLGKHTCSGLNEKDLRAYRAARYAEGVQEVSVNNELVLLKCAITFAKGRGLILSSVFDTLVSKAERRRVFIPYVQKHKFVRLSDDDFEKIVAGIENEESRLVARLALATGMRISEVVNLTWDRVLLDRIVLSNSAEYMTKNGKDRDVPLTLRRRAMLPQRIVGVNRVYTVTQEGTGLAWRNAVKKAKMSDVHFHDLRHEWASRFMEAGGTLTELMTAGGWSSLLMVQRYSKADDARIAAVSARMES